MIDFSRKYNRLFAIGCSFTSYNNWPTWAAALSVELGVPLYNLGHSAASNKYIQNQLFLLDDAYKLTEDDIVITQWSMHSRVSVLGDSFYSNSHEWKHCGDLTSNRIEDSQKIQSSFAIQIDEWQTYNTLLLESQIAIKSSIVYQNTLPCTCINLQIQPMLEEEKMVSIRGKIMPSFVNILFPGYDTYADVLDDRFEIHSKDSDLYSKYRKRNLLRNAIKDKEKYDVHPLPTEHITYLEKIFEHQFSNQVKEYANQDEEKWFKNPDVANVIDRDNTYYKLEQLQQKSSLPG
jgi:hypothetical protein